MDLQRLLLGQLAELAHMPVRGDHEMARRVGELVQQDEGAPAPMHHQRRLVVACLGDAEDAAFLLIGGRDVLESPRCPELPCHCREILRSDLYFPVKSVRMRPAHGPEPSSLSPRRLGRARRAAPLRSLSTQPIRLTTIPARIAQKAVDDANPGKWTFMPKKPVMSVSGSRTTLKMVRMRSTSFWRCVITDSFVSSSA